VFSLLMRGFSSDDVIRAQALGKVVWIQVFTRMSRYTLSIFFFHHLVMLWPIWWFGHQQGDAYFYYGRVMATPYAFGVAAFILIVSYALTWIWDEVAPWLSLEYWVQKVIAD